jgi:ApeA N-terminal domain 1
LVCLWRTPDTYHRAGLERGTATSTSTKPGTTSDDRPRGYTASTIHVEPLEIQVRRGLKLTLETTWSVEGPDDKRVLSTPLVVKTTSTTPKSWQQHLAPLIAVQDLINLAYQGFVPAGRATVEFQCADDGHQRPTPEMWNSRFMTTSSGVTRPESMTEFPLFNLANIGGVRGVRNWIRLDDDFPRATGPLINAYRFGASGLELRLIEVALGLEYWTRVHSDMGRAWAQPRRIRKRTWEPLPMAIGRHVGPAFGEFVGDLAKWSTRFWDTYNKFKHAPSFDYDTNEIRLLGESGALLLLGVLLNRAAGNKTPMRVILQSHRTHMIGYDMRRLLANS